MINSNYYASDEVSKHDVKELREIQANEAMMGGKGDVFVGDNKANAGDITHANANA